MLHITLGPERWIYPSTDDLRRNMIGFSPRVNDTELYEANHGCWKLGSRAQRERYYLASFDGIVRQAVEIDRVERSAPGSARSVIHGRILHRGDPVSDRWVNRPSPVRGVRNPIRYFSDETDVRPCRCGCGGHVTGSEFLPGHDQAALQDRVKQIGTVADFLTWSDIVRGNKPPR